MEIIKKPVAELSLDPANARAHTEKNLSAIKASLRRFGQQKPIVISEAGVVVAGNGTLEAARELGWTDIKCVVSELKGPDQTAFAIADNRTGELATWDEEILGSHLQALREDDWDLGDLGFDIEDVSKFEHSFDHEIEDDDLPSKEAKYLLEIEFSDDDARKQEYEELCSRGLIVRFR